jgi:tRNA(adenine34) deaminase
MEQDRQDYQANDEYWMRQALMYADRTAALGEVPVGAVLVCENRLLAGSGNIPISSNDPTAHAEILVLRAAAKKAGNYRLPGTTLYVTLEPCVMCMGAIIHARIQRLVFGAHDPKTGAAASVYQIGSDRLLNHSLQITGGVLADNSANMLKDFFAARRNVKSTD